MTFKKFKQLWIENGLPLPTKTDHSPRLVEALVGSPKVKTKFLDITKYKFGVLA